MKELMEKELTRREFITHVGLMLLIITGVHGLLKSLGDLSKPKVTHKQTIQTGYGSSSYGV